MSPPLDCTICHKHKNLHGSAGAAIADQGGWMLTHFPFLADEKTTKGHLLLESKRHITDLTELTDVEAAAMGGLIVIGGQLIKSLLKAEHVYVFRINDKVAHLHFHLIPRYPGTPKEYWGLKIGEWPDRPTVTLAEIQDLSQEFITRRRRKMEPGTLYCPMVWENAAIRTNGDYRVCCYYAEDGENAVLADAQGSALNMRETTVDQTRNHRVLKEARKTFLKGEWPEGCRRCQLDEQQGVLSGRNHMLTRLAEAGCDQDLRLKVERLTQPDGGIEPRDFPIRELDIRFGNKCNLRCRSCGPGDSSAWYGDTYRLGRKKFEYSGATLSLEVAANGVVVTAGDTFRWFDGVDLLARFPADLSQLSRIYFVGGEPLIIKEHVDFLRQLIQANLNRQLFLEYNTNLTVLSDEVLDLWRQFKFVGVGISLDGFGKFHEYLRFPGKFAPLEKNMRKIDQVSGNMRSWLSCTVSALNAAHLPDLILWKQRQNFKNIVNHRARPPVSIHLLHHPLHLNLKALPAAGKRYIAEQLSEGIRRIEQEPGFPAKKIPATRQMLEGVVGFMNSEDLSAEWPQLWQQTVALDRLRGQSFADLEPELAGILANAR